MEPIRKYLCESNGNTEMNVYGTVVPADFRYTVPEGKSFIPSQMWVSLSTIGESTLETFGDLPALVLGVGISFNIHKKGLLFNILSYRIKRNLDWGDLFGAQVEGLKNSVDVRWVIPQYLIHERPLVSGDYIQVRVRDNLAAIGSFKITIDGLQGEQ